MNKGLYNFIKGIEVKEGMDISDWKIFKISDLFKVERSKYHNPNQYESGIIPYIARTTFNNGEVKSVSTSEKLYPANCIIIGAESARAFYQEKPFITGNKVYRIYATKDSKLNKYVGLFLCTLLNKEGEKYNYTNAFIAKRIEETKIPLPVKDNKPDWDKMEEIIKSFYSEIEKFII